MKGTKLWQAPGSPIIQGRSRTERPFWERWLAAFVGASVLFFVAAVGLALRQPGDLGAIFQSVLKSLMVPAIPGCAIGSALGVLLSRTMGWRKHLIVGSVIGAALAALTLAVF